MNKGLYLWYREVKQKSPSGQIAALLTIIIAIIFLFIAITINIGKISGVKTATNIAATGAAMATASGLASFGHMLSEKFIDGGTENCEFNWLGFLNLLLIIASIVMFIFAPYIGWAVLLIGPLFLGGIIGLTTANLLIAPYQAEVINRLMAKLTADVAVREGTIQYALFATVSDPEQVIDYNDYDEDGRTDDKVSRFFAWNVHRLLWLAKEAQPLETAVGALKNAVAEFYGRCGGMRYYISADNKWPDPPEGDFIALLQDIEGKKDEPDEEKGIVYDFIPPESWEAYEASKNVFDLQLKTNKTSNDNIVYDFTFWKDGMNASNADDPVNDEVDAFYQDLQSFEEWCVIEIEPPEPCHSPPCPPPEIEKGFLQMNTSELVKTINGWHPTLKNWIEETFYDWQYVAFPPVPFKDTGPLDKWEKELLNKNSGSLLNKIDTTRGDLVNQIDKLKAILKEKQNRLAEVQEKKAADEAELDELNATLTEKEDRLAELQAKKPEDLTDAEKAEMETLEAEIGELKSSISALEDTIAAENAEIQSLNDEIEHLNSLITALEAAIETLDKIGSEDYSDNEKNIYFAADKIQWWRDKYTELRTTWDAFEIIYATINQKAPNFAEYSWQDSLGPHTVKVQVNVNVAEPRTDDGSIIPTVHAYTKHWGFHKCVALRNYQGNVEVTVTRTDSQVKDVNLVQRLLWTFSSPSVKSTARVNYDIYNVQPQG